METDNIRHLPDTLNAPVNMPGYYRGYSLEREQESEGFKKHCVLVAFFADHHTDRRNKTLHLRPFGPSFRTPILNVQLHRRWRILSRSKPSSVPTLARRRKEIAGRHSRREVRFEWMVAATCRIT